jgi:hypothetical protein
MKFRIPAKSPPAQLSPKYPWRSYSPLRTHDFVEGIFKSSPSLRFFVCRRCDRRFRFDPDEHTTWAVGTDENLSALHSAANRRWLSEQCVGQRSEVDREDSKRIKGSRAR